MLATWKKALSDLAKALKIREAGQLPIKAWSFITPRKLAHKVLVTLEAEARKNGLAFSHLESTYLSKSLLDHPHLIKELPYLHVSQLEEVLREALDKLPRKDPNPEPRAGEPAAKDAPPRRPVPGVGSDPPGEARVALLRSRICSQEDKVELRAIAYGSSDPVTQVNAILGLCNAFGPADDKANDLITLCQFGERLAHQLGDSGVQGFLIATVGSLVSFQHARLYLEVWASDQADRSIGLTLTPHDQRERKLQRLDDLKRRYRAAFSSALELTAGANDAVGFAGVLILVGNDAGQRAAMMRGVGENDAAEAELSVCKSAYLNAKALFSDAGDEGNAANAIYNLAHQIYYHGEIGEAKNLTQKVLATAEKLGDAVLLQKAKWLMDTLNGGKIPDYARGERRRVDPKA